MGYKRIMVAIDGSKAANLVLTEAISLASALKAKLCIVHAVELFPIYNLELSVDFNQYQESVRADGHATLNKFKKFSEKKKCKVDVKLIEINNVVDRISEQILHAAKKWKTDLLVFGTHGRRGFNRLLLGSVAEEAIRIATIPTLLIRVKDSSK